MNEIHRPHVRARIDLGRRRITAPPYWVLGTNVPTRDSQNVPEQDAERFARLLALLGPGVPEQD